MRFAVIPSLPAAGRRSKVRFSIARFLCDESLFDQNAKEREISHFADSVRNDEFEDFQQAVNEPEPRCLMYLPQVAPITFDFPRLSD
jgi:hypothetical protein